MKRQPTLVSDSSRAQGGAEFDRAAHNRRIARLGGLAFAATHDGHAATEKAREAFRTSFERRLQLEHPDLDGTEIRRRADALRRMHFVRAGLKSGEARRRRARSRESSS